ncbi:hypothetical protein BYT27DRAFT_7260853 [Phlegmacium glaucopus]|nr:hypothetical protein BYT27DRAFT_7260853 [Phlegmacium glaucopus]
MQPTEKSTVNQPQAATEMSVMRAAEGSAPNAQQGNCEHKHQKASRLRGGGAAKVCNHPDLHILPPLSIFDITNSTCFLVPWIFHVLLAITLTSVNVFIGLLHWPCRLLLMFRMLRGVFSSNTDYSLKRALTPN